MSDGIHAIQRAQRERRERAELCVWAFHPADGREQDRWVTDCGGAVAAEPGAGKPRYEQCPSCGKATLVKDPPWAYAKKTTTSEEAASAPKGA